jgi:ribonucleoside-diphosphate reductase alpha chain
LELGVQGLADAFIMMRYSFESEEAKQLNKDIFETIYYAAVTASKDLLSKKVLIRHLKVHLISKGIFQFDMWNVTPSQSLGMGCVERRSNKTWCSKLSYLLAPMPTASTSQILGNNECFEPYTSNIYTRRVLSGEFMVVNKHLLT